MIDPTATDSYNNRITATLGQLDRLTTSQRDQINTHGDRAENLLRNPDLVQFIHEARFTVMDALAGIASHDADSNLRRVALANQLSGIDQFVATLQRAVYMRNRLVSEREGPSTPQAAPLKEVYKP